MPWEPKSSVASTAPSQGGSADTLEGNNGNRIRLRRHLAAKAIDGGAERSDKLHEPVDRVSTHVDHRPSGKYDEHIQKADAKKTWTRSPQDGPIAIRVRVDESRLSSLIASWQRAGPGNESTRAAITNCLSRILTFGHHRLWRLVWTKMLSQEPSLTIPSQHRLRSRTYSHSSSEWEISDSIRSR